MTEYWPVMLTTGNILQVQAFQRNNNILCFICPFGKLKTYGGFGRNIINFGVVLNHPHGEHSYSLSASSRKWAVTLMENKWEEESFRKCFQVLGVQLD